MCSCSCGWMLYNSRFQIGFTGCDSARPEPTDRLWFYACSHFISYSLASMAFYIEESLYRTGHDMTGQDRARDSTGQGTRQRKGQDRWQDSEQDRTEQDRTGKDRTGCDVMPHNLSTILCSRYSMMLSYDNSVLVWHHHNIMTCRYDTKMFQEYCTTWCFSIVAALYDAGLV